MGKQSKGLKDLPKIRHCDGNCLFAKLYLVFEVSEYVELTDSQEEIMKKSKNWLKSKVLIDRWQAMQA